MSDVYCFRDDGCLCPKCYDPNDPGPEPIEWLPEALRRMARRKRRMSGDADVLRAGAKELIRQDRELRRAAKILLDLLQSPLPFKPQVREKMLDAIWR